MAESRGMLIIRSGDTSILFRASLFNASNDKVVTGTTNLRIWHVIPTTGVIEAYDFNDNTFKTTALTTDVLAMTHYQVDNSTYDTGVWTVRHTTLTDFVKGDKYIAEISNTLAIREVQSEFQYGDCEGDQRVDLPDDVWDENVTGHVAASSAGAALDALGTAIDGRTNNANLDALLGVADTAAFDLAYTIWDEANATHVGAGSVGLHLNALGALIAARSNNANLNALLGVADTAAFDIAHTIWDEDIVAAHATADTAGLLLRALGAVISQRSNNATLNAMMGVPDVDGATGGVVHLASTATGGTAGTIVDTARTESVTDFWQGNLVKMLTGNAAGQIRAITGFVTATDTLSVSPDFKSTILSGDEYAILQSAAETTGVSTPALAAIADAVWNEDIVAAHGTSDTGGLLLRALGAEISQRTNNLTLNDLLGVPDTAATDTVAGQVWEETVAGHNTASSMGEVMNNIVAAAFPSVVSIADGVWDEDIVAAHATADTAGLLLRALGAVISQRTNNATLNALLAVPDTAAFTIAETLWDEDISTHSIAASAGLALDALGSAIGSRTNNPTLNSLLGVTDAASNDIAYTIWDELTASHAVANSAGQRLQALDLLLEAAGAGDAAVILTQVNKLDTNALSGSPDADSVAGKLNALSTTLATVDRDIISSINLEGANLRIEVAAEQYGVIQTTPYTQASAQIFDEANAIIATISIGNFAAITSRGFFQYTLNPHPLVAGATYQIQITLSDGGANTYQNTKLFKVVNV